MVVYAYHHQRQQNGGQDLRQCHRRNRKVAQCNQIRVLAQQTLVLQHQHDEHEVLRQQNGIFHVGQDRIAVAIVVRHHDGVAEHFQVEGSRTDAWYMGDNGNVQIINLVEFVNVHFDYEPWAVFMANRVRICGTLATRHIRIVMMLRTSDMNMTRPRVRKSIFNIFKLYISPFAPNFLTLLPSMVCFFTCEFRPMCSSPKSVALLLNICDVAANEWTEMRRTLKNTINTNAVCWYIYYIL